MSASDLVLRVIALFEQLAIPYMLVGSFSSNYYGRPRSTRDADFVVLLQGDSLKRLHDALGPDFHLDPQISFETLTMTTRHVITHPATAFKIELFLLSEDPHDQKRFARRQSVEFQGQKAWLPTAEDVIIQKLRWHGRGRRAKDFLDVVEVLGNQGNALDLEYIRFWTTLHNTNAEFERLLLASQEA